MGTTYSSYEETKLGKWHNVVFAKLRRGWGGDLTHAQLDTNKLCKYTAKLLNWLLGSLCACVFLAFGLGWQGAAGERLSPLIKT